MIKQNVHNVFFLISADDQIVGEKDYHCQKKTIQICPKQHP